MARAARREGVLKTWLVRAGQITLTVAVTWLIVDLVDLDLAELRGMETSAWVPDLVPLVGASLLLLAAYFVSAALWGLIVHELGGPRIPPRESIQLFMIANLGRYIPGKVWQLAGLATLAKGRGVPAATATGAAVLGQGIALVAASAIGIGALLSGPEPYRRWGAVGAVLVVAGIVIGSIPRVFRALTGHWFRLTRTEAPAQLDAVHGLRWLGLYTLNWAMYALAFWVFTQSLGLRGELVPVASAFAAAYLVGYAVFFAPAGLGPREAALVLFLTPHLGAAPSGVVAVGARVWMTLVEVVPAGIFWLSHVASTRSSDVTGGPAGDST